MTASSSSEITRPRARLVAAVVIAMVTGACTAGQDGGGATSVATLEPAAAASSTTPMTSPQPAGLRFVELAEAAGVALVHQSPLVPMKDGAEMMGGAAVGDFDADGYPDLFVIGGGLRPDALYHNQGDGTFVDIAAEAGVDEPHVGSGATVGDFDGDGLLDLYVTGHGPPQDPGPGGHRLYRNNGDLTFTDVAGEAGVASTSSAVNDGFGAAFADVDLDGDLDLFVAGWQQESGGNRLFRNRGDGTFADVTDEAGIVADHVRGFSPCFADMNRDRFPELMLVADFGTTLYFVNRGGETFFERTDRSGAGLEWSGMGTAVGDVDNDGAIDWFTTAIYDDDRVGRGDGNKLYLNRGRGRFDEAAAESGVDDGGWGWGAVIVDLDNDGWQDIVETNGWRLPSYESELAKVWLNRGDGTFDEVAAETGMDHDRLGLTVLHLDYDLDGDQDIAITTPGERFRLYRNDLADPEAHWLRVALDTSGRPGLAPNGFGATVVVTAGGAQYTRHVNGCANYAGQSELVPHLGLGSATNVDRIEVTWPDGSTTTVEDVSVDRTITIRPG